MKFIKNPFYVLLLATVLATFIISAHGENGIRRLFELRSEKQELSAKIADIQAENERIRREIQALNNNNGHIERIAREELGMVRENEIIFFVPD